jgi:hypothetical protein
MNASVEPTEAFSFDADLTKDLAIGANHLARINQPNSARG